MPVESDAWNSRETSVCGTQRAGSLIDEEKIRKISRNWWNSVTIVQGVNLVFNSSSDWQPVEGSEQRLNLHAVFTLCQGQDKMHYFAFSAGDPACFHEDPPTKIPSLTEPKTKPVSFSQQAVGVSRTIEKTCRFSSHHRYSSTFSSNLHQSIDPHLPLTVTSSSSSLFYLQK